MSIDIVLTLDEDCLSLYSDECSALHGFIQTVAETIDYGATDARLAILMRIHGSSPETLFDFSFWEANKHILVDTSFLAQMPCYDSENSNDTQNIDPSAQLSSAMALMQSQSSVDRIRKILMINTCDPTDDDAEDLLCSVMPALLEALDIELILINAAHLELINLQLYTCLIDQGQLDSEYFTFAEITDESLATTDDDIITQLCSPNDVAS